MSDQPLAERLQVKRDRRLAVVGAAPALDAAIGAADRRADPADADVLLLFARDGDRLRATLERVPFLSRAGSILWIAYPKRTSGLARDLRRDVVRALAADHGFDVVSQIAIDGDWSALRLKRLS